MKKQFKSGGIKKKKRMSKRTGFVVPSKLKKASVKSFAKKILKKKRKKHSSKYPRESIFGGCARLPSTLRPNDNPRRSENFDPCLENFSSPLLSSRFVSSNTPLSKKERNQIGEKVLYSPILNKLKENDNNKKKVTEDPFIENSSSEEETNEVIMEEVVKEKAKEERKSDFKYTYFDNSGFSSEIKIDGVEDDILKNNCYYHQLVCGLKNFGKIDNDKSVTVGDVVKYFNEQCPFLLK